MDNLTPEEYAFLSECRHAKNEYLHKWLQALCEFPRLAVFCNVWSEFTSGAWAVLLAHQPGFINKAPLKSLTVNEWVYILSWQPQLIGQCRKTLQFSSAQRSILLQKQPGLAGCIPAEKSRRRIKKH